MKKALFILSIAVCFVVKAQTPYVAIPDSNFVHYLKTIVPTAFKGDSLNTSSTLVTTTTHSINCSNYLTIASLSGIQYFTSLTWLDCNNNSFTTLPALPNSLIYLDCGDNGNLTSLPALPNTLSVLKCSQNSLTSLPTLPASLTYLDCSLGAITSLPVLPNLLTHLYCEGNWITVLPSLPASLNYLECEGNALTSLPALPNLLDTLYCNNNNITCFPIFPNAITCLVIGSNPFNCLPNYIPAMTIANSANGAVSDSVVYPKCTAGNTNACPIAAAGIEKFTNNKEYINIFPNPNNGLFNLTISKFDNLKRNHIEIYNITGDCVHRQIATSSNCQIDLSNLNEGVYNISLQINEGVVNKRLVIVR